MSKAEIVGGIIGILSVVAVVLAALINIRGGERAAEELRMTATTQAEAKDTDISIAVQKTLEAQVTPTPLHTPTLISIPTSILETSNTVTSTNTLLPTDTPTLTTTPTPIPPTPTSTDTDTPTDTPAPSPTATDILIYGYSLNSEYIQTVFVGGTYGDLNEIITCPANYAVTGLVGDADNDKIYKIQLVCNELNADGTTSSSTFSQAGGVVTRNTGDKVVCENNMVFIGVQGRANAWGYVNNLQGICSKVGQEDESITTGIGGSQGADLLLARCPSEHVITGLDLKFGGWIGKVSLICTRVDFS